jgi:hypothetical protein
MTREQKRTRDKKDKTREQCGRMTSSVIEGIEEREKDINREKI